MDLTKKESSGIEVTTPRHEETKSVNGVASKRTIWNFFGARMPKAELLFFAQTIMIYIVVTVCLYNLSKEDVNKKNQNEKLWITMLSSCVGYMLPSPSYKPFN